MRIKGSRSPSGHSAKKNTQPCQPHADRVGMKNTYSTSRALRRLATALLTVAALACGDTPEDPAPLDDDIKSPSGQGAKPSTDGGNSVLNGFVDDPSSAAPLYPAIYTERVI